MKRKNYRKWFAEAYPNRNNDVAIVLEELPKAIAPSIFLISLTVKYDHMPMVREALNKNE